MLPEVLDGPRALPLASTIFPPSGDSSTGTGALSSFSGGDAKGTEDGRGGEVNLASANV